MGRVMITTLRLMGCCKYNLNPLNCHLVYRSKLQLSDLNGYKTTLSS